VFEAASRSCEMILLNDGGHDQSWRVIQELADQNPIGRGLDLMQNCGQHKAFLVGIQAARSEIIVAMDNACSRSPRGVQTPAWNRLQSARVGWHRDPAYEGWVTRNAERFEEWGSTVLLAALHSDYLCASACGRTKCTPSVPAHSPVAVRGTGADRREYGSPPSGSLIRVFDCGHRQKVAGFGRKPQSGADGLVVYY
jgi:hypothetical protein